MAQQNEQLIWKWRYLVLRALSILVWHAVTRRGPMSEDTEMQQLRALSAMDAVLDELKSCAGLS